MLLLKQVEKVFVIFSLVFFTGAIGVLMNGGTAPSSLQIDLISRLSSYVIQAGTFCLIFAWHRRIIRTVIQEKFLWFLVAIALASVFWSEETRATLGGSQNLIRITLFGVYFAARYSLKEQLRLLAWAFGIGATLSLVFVLALPSYGVMGQGSIVTGEAITHAGAWQGIYGHKNILGRIMVLSAVVFLIFALSSRRYSWLAWVSFGLSVVLILGSTSKTSLIIFLTIMALLPFYRALRWSYTIAVPFFITVILVAGSVAMLLVSGAEDILGVFGRDLTLTGRTDLWAAVLDKIWQRPWLGYGYGAFWRGWNGESADVWSVVSWEAPHSHNGFLDLWLDLGLLGLLAFTLSFIALCLRAVSWVRQTKTAEGLWPLAYLTFLLLANLTESSLLRQNTLWILYVVVTFSTHNKRANQLKSNTSCKQKLQQKQIKQGEAIHER
jgi:O-antigen ligase